MGCHQRSIACPLIVTLRVNYDGMQDVHSRYRTEAHADVVARFNERFLLSLAVNPHCLVVDDELNILPISSHAKSIQPIAAEVGSVCPGPTARPSMVVSLLLQDVDEVLESAHDRDLKKLKLEMQETKPVGPLVNACKTLDQVEFVVLSRL